MKPTLLINFTDFWGGFNKQQNIFIDMLQQQYDVKLSDQPDVLFFSCFGFEFLKFDCHKIYYTGENTRPKFTECDFALTFDYNWPTEKHYRLPLYRWRGDLEQLATPKNVQAIMAQKTKFCCMLISNPNGKERNAFYHQLSKYKQVDSGGGYLNNIGYRVPDKMAFIQQYKFVLSFENSSYPGYTTEKIVEPMTVNSLPIYWGNPLIGKEFNTQSFVNIHDYPTYDAAIEAIIAIDNDAALFEQYVAAPFYNNNIFPENLQFDVITERLVQAIQHFEGTTPVSTQHRLYNHLNKWKRKVYFKLTKNLV